ncbi:unnamed protein product, partial [Staurois parvus]
PEELIPVAVPPLQLLRAALSALRLVFEGGLSSPLSAHAPLRLIRVDVRSCAECYFGGRVGAREGREKMAGKCEGQPGRGARRRGTSRVCEDIGGQVLACGRRVSPRNGPPT